MSDICGYRKGFKAFIHMKTKEKISLPMLKRYPILAGALVGILLRLVFSGDGGSRWSAMTAAFIFIAPIVVGMVTVYLAERQERRSWNYYWMAPFIATSLFVAGTLLLFIEGWICAIVIIPMFAVLGGLGRLLMGLVCRLTKWPRSTLVCVSVLPFVLVISNSLIPAPTEIGEIERSITVKAPPSEVWSVLNDVRSIRREEMSDALASKIGVPMPVSGITVKESGEWVRVSKWGKGVYFNEIIQEWQSERYMRWTYRFSEDSFPRAALDDHVVMGGHYFDLIDTSYTLRPIENGSSTHLTTRVHYRISTQFNFYADWAAQILLGNLSEVGLRLYKARSERLKDRKVLGEGET